jgi:hypothetical protein
MQLLRIAIKAAGLLAAVAGFWFGALPAGATGTIIIRQSDGDTNTYDDVKILISHGTLYLTSADGKGTLVVHRAACSHQGQLLVCLPTSATLVQSGAAKPLDFRNGTVYVNSTDSPQPLVLSTQKVPANGILLSLETKIGTYISLRGQIDKVVK